jgi:hypothetical protein
MLTQTNDTITSDVTTHTAQRDGPVWRLSFLPGREWSRAQAEAGMCVADTVACGQVGGVWEGHWVAQWALALGEPVSALVAAVRRPPHEATRSLS